MDIVALESGKSDGKVFVSDTEGFTASSNNLDDLFEVIAYPYDNAIKVVWDMEQFLKPILPLLPKATRAKLINDERVYHNGSKLFWAVSKGQLFGVNHCRHIKDNIYEEGGDETVYQLKTFYPNELAPTTLQSVKDKGSFLLDTLSNMVLHPTRLVSPAGVYAECVLGHMGIATIFDMPEDTLELAEWAANYVREWRTCYQVGYFPTAYDYDLTSGYPSVLAQVPDFHNAKYIQTNGEIPKGIFWGILKGQWDITAEVSPIVSKDGVCYKGCFSDFATTTELAIAKKWGWGTFRPEKAWFVKFPNPKYIFDTPMRSLYQQRNGNELQNYLAKNMAASTWGRFVQMIGNKFGDFYMPPIACMVTSKVRCLNCDFIYSNDLADNLISVMVDGCLTTKQTKMEYADREFGKWRLNGTSEALVLSDTWQWLLDKKPLNKTLSDMLHAIHAHPKSHAYHGLGLSMMEHSRNFPTLPKTGEQLLSNVYYSAAIQALS